MYVLINKSDYVTYENKQFNFISKPTHLLYLQKIDRQEFCEPKFNWLGRVGSGSGGRGKGEVV